MSDAEPTVDEIAPGNWGVFQGDKLLQGGAPRRRLRRRPGTWTTNV
jgi:hypothetical protein